MDANGHELICRDEVYAIISCALAIIKGIGHGLHEKPKLEWERIILTY